ncbi:conserved protein of unknown function [Methylotuvimicrobium alcaliphilum 20Z]|uniref:DUF72 domain-containing protein n=1 Tax=Methylotuvimicrobium alcaliphilum (strain DSM 19304 / NCIMB 14124 / VKM B-2133 / 20Z) TaxID=1091494 RepID=G4SW48_META2|nr:DUF72 domain-containing protein [Methylotuvimicrobium alcaliphilum]CCE21969.1 conserved protein of unknown function [Methylotuvimicrobium alcaliphilum 20Z]
MHQGLTKLYIGTSDWCYRHWRDCFYQKTTQKAWLKFYSERFNAIEINGTFYRLQKTSTFEKWYALPLAEKLSAILWQLPQPLKKTSTNCTVLLRHRNNRRKRLPNTYNKAEPYTFVSTMMPSAPRHSMH